MEKLRYGGLASLKTDVGKNVKSFPTKHVFTTLLLMLLCMIISPSVVKAEKITIDFVNAGVAAYEIASGDNTGSYANIVMTDQNYSNITNAKIGKVINYKYNGKYTRSTDLSRLAFAVNTNGSGNTHNANDGWYLRGEKTGQDNKYWKCRGLYTGQNGGANLALLNLYPGDKVTVTFSASSNVASYGAGVHNEHDDFWIGSGTQFEVGFSGDLILHANVGTVIEKIEIETLPEATYSLTTEGTTSTFQFTGAGRITENDFAVPYMSFSFGSVDDNIIVDEIGGNLQSRMLKADGTETLETNGENSQPSAGNFYAFRPTGGGEISITGGIQGNCVHLFVYDPSPNVKGWVQTQPDVYYKETFNAPSSHYGTFTFTVEKNKIYYVCINNLDQSEHGNAFHLHSFTFTNTFRLNELAKVVDLEKETGNTIFLTQIQGAGGLGQNPVHVKKCSGNIDVTNILPATPIDQYGNFYINKPTFLDETKDKAGTVILDINTQGGEATFVVTFPYHADYGWDEATGRSHGHIWNFIDPRLSDSNSGNSKVWDGYSGFADGPATTGILSIGQYKNPSSQMRHETDDREWTESWTIKSLSGEITDPMYKNVYDMVGDNADMIWETEGLWFDTASNLSCLYNENDAMDGLGQPTQHLQTMTSDPDRYVGLVAVKSNETITEGAPSFTIPGLKDGDRVLIYMKSADKSGSDREAIFLNIEGALDAVGTPIVSTDLYGAGGTEYSHSRYEGCYHFIKDASETPMKFTMVRGAICKLMYIQIYTGKRIDTDHIERGGTSPLLFLNDEGTAQENAAGGYYNLHYRGKGENIKAQVLVKSGNLTDNSFSSDKYYYNKTNNYEKTAINFKSTVGEFGVFRLRLMDMDFIHDNGNASGLSGQGYKYVCDFADRNFTVGYREKKSYPYTWDFTDMMGFSSSDIAAENTNYPETTNKYERKGWDISFWDEDGYMLIGNEYDPSGDGEIFSQNKNGFGNQLYANNKIIPETQGLWFYMDDNNPVHNRCMQITSEGLHFVNQNLGDDNHNPWWNYKMVVPSVPSGAAVYLRMKRDPRIEETDKKYSDQDLANVLFLNTRFHFGTSSETNPKTSLTEDTQDVYATTKNEGNYAFFKVPGTEDEYILVVKNTGAEDHLTFTLNGWIVKKLSVSEDFKKVNKFGWATESRDHVIDQALTTELTGNTFETYVVTGADYASKTVTIEKVDTSKKVMKKASEGGNQAYIIRNMDMDDSMKDANGKDAPGLVKILDDGFHLFVPDMHDFIKNRQDGFTNQKSERDMGSSKMKALLGPQTLNKKGEGNIYNYVLTTTVNQVGMDVEKPLNDVGFYRVKNGSSSAGNQGYLPVDCTVPTGTTDGGGAKMSLVFVSFDDSSENVETAIEVPFEVVSGSNNAVYYNLNGQKMSGKPAKGGLYIMNGKKILVK